MQAQTFLKIDFFFLCGSVRKSIQAYSFIQKCVLILNCNKCYQWEPLSWSILIHPSSPLKAATWAGVCPSLSRILTSGVYCSSVRRDSLCPPTHTSWRGVRPVFVLETGLWFCYKDIIISIFQTYKWMILIYVAFYS